MPILRHRRERSLNALFPWVALGILAAMASTGLYPISIAAFLAAGLLILTRCLPARAARRGVEWSILLVIAAGLGIAAAMQKTGAAAFVAGTIAAAAGSLGPVATLAVVYLLNLVLAESLQHDAAVAIMSPIAVATAAQVGADRGPSSWPSRSEAAAPSPPPSPIRLT